MEKCTFCSKQNTLSILPDSFRAYADNDEFQEIVKFECRGTEPVEFQPSGEWKCQSALSDIRFTKIDLSEVIIQIDDLVHFFRLSPTMMKKPMSL